MIADPKRKPRQDDGDRAPREHRGCAFDEALQNAFPASERVSAAAGQGPAAHPLAILAGRLPDDRPEQGHRMGPERTCMTCRPPRRRSCLAILVSPFRSKCRLEAENAALRHQLIVLRRKMQGRVRLTNNDRWFFIQLYRWFLSILQVLTIIRPETLVRWHRAGFRCYWRWKSRSVGGRPQLETDLRMLIRRMSIENPLWGAPRIHGELLKLGFEAAQSSVAKYMVKRRGSPSQAWRTFLRNHAPDIAAMDLFVAPTIGFDLLYAFVIVRRCMRMSSSIKYVFRTNSGKPNPAIIEASHFKPRGCSQPLISSAGHLTSTEMRKRTVQR